jgi:hypothetical protein
MVIYAEWHRPTCKVIFCQHQKRTRKIQKEPVRILAHRPRVAACRWTQVRPAGHKCALGKTLGMCACVTQRPGQSLIGRGDVRGPSAAAAAEKLGPK